IGVVDQLARDGQLTRAEPGRDYPYRVEREDFPHPQELQSCQVRPVVDPVRGYVVPVPVAGQEPYAAAAELDFTDRRRWRPVGRDEQPPRRQAGEIAEAGACQDGEWTGCPAVRRIRHSASTLTDQQNPSISPCQSTSCGRSHQRLRRWAAA